MSRSTPVWLEEAEAEVLKRVAAAPGVFFFLDYDGTLAPLAPTPDAARPLPGTDEVLSQLARTQGTQVALVTGRTVAAVRRFVNVARIFWVGIHGLETYRPDGTTELSEDTAAVRALLRPIKQRLEEELASHPGILIEDKGLALACHYRLATRADAAVALRCVTAAVQPLRRRGLKIGITHGHEVVEIRPPNANKGKAVCRLLATHGAASLPVYIGDDQTDEDAFILLPPDAITIRVGSPRVRTAARYRAHDPREVLAFLRAAAARRRRRGAARSPSLPRPRRA